MAAPRDPFAPGSGSDDEPLELVGGGRPTRPPVDPSSPVQLPPAREPLKYKKPGGGWVTLLVLTLALAGLGAGVVIFGKRLRSTASSVPAVAPPPKPVTYRALDMEDAVLITVSARPRDARLFVDGEPMASNPLRLPRGTVARTITGQAEGFEPGTVAVVPDAAKTVRLELRRSGR